MNKIKWGIIGCGDVTEVKSGPAFNKVPDSSLVAVMRRDGEKAKDYARRHQVPKWYDDAGKLLDDPEINAIYIATPPQSHEAYTLMSLAAGKPVYVEKPMTMNALSAIKMKEAADFQGVKLTVAHYRREQPMFLKIKQLLADQVIGHVRFVNLQMYQPLNSNIIANSETNWRLDPAISGGGLFHDLAPHQIDLMVYFFGKPKWMSGIGLNQAGAYQADDLVSGQVLFEKGVVFNGTWCFTVDESQRSDVCEIIGADGKISFPMFGNTVDLTIGGQKEQFVFDSLSHVEQPMIEKVVDYFLDRGTNPCSAEQAILTMEIMDGFTQKVSR